MWGFYLIWIGVFSPLSFLKVKIAIIVSNKEFQKDRRHEKKKPLFTLFQVFQHAKLKWMKMTFVLYCESSEYFIFCLITRWTKNSQEDGWPERQALYIVSSFLDDTISLVRGKWEWSHITKKKSLHLEFKRAFFFILQNLKNHYFKDF